MNDVSPGKLTSSTESLSSADGNHLQGFIATTAQVPMTMTFRSYCLPACKRTSIRS